jgi:hypothetical protein
MSPNEFAVVFALARCGILCEKPTEAYLHQMTRLVEILPPDQAKPIQDLLDWHNAGRIVSNTKFAPR